MSHNLIARISRAGAAIATLCLAACGGGSEPAVPVAVNGWDTYGNASNITCGTRPVLLSGNRMDLTVAGPCRTVRVVGNHNDIDVAMVSGGMIEITGGHNDVTWHLPQGVAGTPNLVDHGDSNTFHAPE